MNISFRSATAPSWLATSAYHKRLGDRTVLTRSYYDGERAAYSGLARQTLQYAGMLDRPVERVMIGGIGDSVAEAEIMTELFPGVRELHLVDWYLPNLLKLEPRLAASALLATDREVVCHFDDLRDPETIEPGSIDIAFANKLFDPYSHEEFAFLHLLNGIARALKPSGILFSLDYPLYEMEGADFYRSASQVDLNWIYPKVLQKRG